jgi:hypothetical protein
MQCAQIYAYWYWHHNTNQAYYIIIIIRCNFLAHTYILLERENKTRIILIFFSGLVYWMVKHFGCVKNTEKRLAV